MTLGVACSDGGDSGAGGNNSGSGGDSTSGGEGGTAPGGGTTGESGAPTTGGTGDAGGESSGGTSGGATGGSGGMEDDFVPLPPGSRELDGIVNLVNEAAASELEAYLITSAGQPYWQGGLTASLNLFHEHYVEEYDFVYFLTDHAVASNTIGKFQNVTQPAMPGTGNDFDWEREGYKTNGRTRAVLGVQFRAGRYGPMGHEMLHYWANHLDSSFGFGFGLDEDFGSHWGYAGVHGVLGGFDPATLRCETPAGAMPPACTPGTNGRTRYVTGLYGENDNGVATPCGPLELYLMGLIPLSEAPVNIPVLVDAGSLVYDTVAGTATVEAASVTNVRLADIVARHGTVRELPANERAFRAAFVVLSAAPAAESVLAEIAEYAKWHGNRAMEPGVLSFEALTGGRATLDTRLGSRRSVADPAPPVRVPAGCDIFEQACGAGKACYFAARNGGFCGLSGDGIRDSPCESSYDCAPGFDCVPNTAGTAGACEPYCSADDTAPDACSSLCPWFILTDENDVEVAGICLAP